MRADIWTAVAILPARARKIRKTVKSGAIACTDNLHSATMNRPAMFFGAATCRRDGKALSCLPSKAGIDGPIALDTVLNTSARIKDWRHAQNKNRGDLLRGGVLLPAGRQPNGLFAATRATPGLASVPRRGERTLRQPIFEPRSPRRRPGIQLLHAGPAATSAAAIQPATKPQCANDAAPATAAARRNHDSLRRGRRHPARGPRRHLHELFSLLSRARLRKLGGRAEIHVVAGRRRGHGHGRLWRHGWFWRHGRLWRRLLNGCH